MPDKRTDRSSFGRYYSLGFELVAAVAGFTLVGYWIDRHFGTAPWGLLIGLGLGLVGGTYNLIRSSLVPTRKTDSGTKPERSASEKEKG